MTRLSCSCSIINVNIANGSTHKIWCRVIGDKTWKVKGATGGGLGIFGFVFNAYTAKHVYHTNVATPGYSEIKIGNTLEFELRPSSKRVFMTVINEIDCTICKSHEILRSRNYIIDRHDSLLEAKKNKKWIDTNGRDHEVPCPELFSFYGKQCGRFHNTYLASMLAVIICSIVIVFNHNCFDF